MGLQIRVWKRGPDDEPIPAELLPKVYGGRWDNWTRAYVGPPQTVAEISAHPGQVPLLTFDEPGVLRFMQLGAPGGGKSRAIAARGVINGAMLPGELSGVVAPTHPRLKIIWNELLNLLRPLGWIKDIRKQDFEIELINGHIYQGVAAQSPSAALGSPLQGYSWAAAIEDETQDFSDLAHGEVETRGRRVGKKYLICSSATVKNHPAFIDWVAKLEASPIMRVARTSGYDNVFVKTEWWDQLRETMSAEDFERRINGIAMPMDRVVYNVYRHQHHVGQAPLLVKDLTGATAASLGAVTKPDYRYIIGTDFGSLVSTSIVLRAVLDPSTRERVWWAVDEVTSRESTTEQHVAKLIKAGFNGDNSLVIGDPHPRKAGADDSDYVYFRRQGFQILKASHTKIPVRHRIGMVNALLEDAKGVRRLFIDPRCRDLIRSLTSFQYKADGTLDESNKDGRDLSHWTDALGYALFMFEKIRGANAIRIISPAGKPARRSFFDDRRGTA